ncbi:MAG: asparagine synthase-related protein [Patescibacteria group bacterium]
MLKIFGMVGKHSPSSGFPRRIDVDNFYENLRHFNNDNYQIAVCGLALIDDCIAEGKNLIVIFQGNLFDRPKTEKTAKHIMDLYNSKHSINFVKNLNGSFNFLLADEKRQVIFIVTDKYGSRPLFIYRNHNNLIFGSEIKLLLSLLSRRAPINWRAWGQYLTFRFTLGQETFYKGIRLIPNGTLIKISYKDVFRIREERYWDFSQIDTDFNSSYKQKILEGVEIARRVFGNLGKTIKGFKTIIALSGGYDSRSIVAGLKKFHGQCEFDTITTLHPCGPEKEIVNELAQSLEIHNTYYIDRPHDIYRRFFVMKAYLSDCLVQEHLWTMPMLEAIKRYDTYIDGIGGDIIMRSTRVRPIHIKMKANTNFLAKLFKKQFGFEYYWLEDYLSPEIWRSIKYTDEWAINELSRIPVTENRMVTFLMKNRIRNGISIVPNNIIGSCIRTVIQPFFNDELVAFGLSIPHAYKFKFIYRQIINTAFPEIRQIISTSDENLEKLKAYDRRIIQFEENPKELISDYSEISKGDVRYLFDLLNRLDFPLFLNRKKIINDAKTNLKVNRINTILDIVLWFNFFEKNIPMNKLLGPKIY